MQSVRSSQRRHFIPPVPGGRSFVAVLIALFVGVPAAAREQRTGAPPATQAKKSGKLKAQRPHAKRRAARAKLRTPKSVPAARSAPRATPLTPLTATIRCPSDMVAVAGRVCVDRYEMSLADRDSKVPWSPWFTPDLDRARGVRDFYEALQLRAAPTSLDARTPLPELPVQPVVPVALSQKGALPQGYLSADQAALACSEAGKRLCTEAEWLTACRGEAQRDFPYGGAYRQGSCNVFREDHPTAMLHANAARFHDDPRNGALVVAGRPLLLVTGGSPACASAWGDDAIFDMVGNLDEWVDDKEGVFVGGFFSRGARNGCFARVSAHPRAYSDYSTGARCCKDP